MKTTISPNNRQQQQQQQEQQQQQKATAHSSSSASSLSNETPFPLNDDSHVEFQFAAVAEYAKKRKAAYNQRNQLKMPETKRRTERKPFRRAGGGGQKESTYQENQKVNQVPKSPGEVFIHPSTSPRETQIAECWPSIESRLARNSIQRYVDKDAIAVPSSEEIWQSYLDVKEGRVNPREANWPISLMCHQNANNGDDDLRGVAAENYTGSTRNSRKKVSQAQNYYYENNRAVRELLSWELAIEKRTEEPLDGYNDGDADAEAEADGDADDDAESDIDDETDISAEDDGMKDWIRSELLNEPLSDIEEYDMLLDMAQDETKHDSLYKLLKPKVTIEEREDSPEPSAEEEEQETQEESEDSEEATEEHPVETDPEQEKPEDEMHMEEVAQEAETIEVEASPNEESSPKKEEEEEEAILEEPIGEIVPEVEVQEPEKTEDEPIAKKEKEDQEEKKEEEENDEKEEEQKEEKKEEQEKEKEHTEQIQELEQYEFPSAEDEMDFASFIEELTTISDQPNTQSIQQEDTEGPVDLVDLVDLEDPDDCIIIKDNDDKVENKDEELEKKVELDQRNVVVPELPELPEQPVILNIEELGMLPPKPTDETAHQDWLQECSQKITEQLQQIAMSVAAPTKDEDIDYEMEISKEQLKPSVIRPPHVKHTAWQNKFVLMLDDFEDDVLQNMTEFRDPQAKRLRSKWYAQCSKTVVDLRRTLMLPAVPHPVNERLQKIRILRRPPKRREPFSLCIDMKYVRSFCTLQLKRQLDLMSLLRVLDNSIYCPDIDVLQKRYEAAQLAWLWRDGTVMIINGRSQKTLAETQRELMSRLLGIRKMLSSAQHCHNVTYLRLTFHAQYPWKIDLNEFTRALVLSPEPLQGTDSRYVYYVNKALPGVAARVFESGAIAVYAMSPAQADQMFECLYTTTSKYRKTETITITTPTPTNVATNEAKKW